MLVQLLYISTPVQAASAAVQDSIAEFYNKNKTLGISTALIATSEFFLQVIEGPRDVVNSLYNTIVNDSNHTAVTMLRYQEIRKLEFEDCPLIFLGDDITCKTFLCDVTEVESLDRQAVTGTLAMTMMRRAVAVHKCLSYPNRRKTDIAAIPALPVV